jgi:valyl-tRNA synthetase
MGVITGIRNIRGEMNLPPSKNVKVVMDTAGTEEATRLNKNAGNLKTLAKVEELHVGVGLEKPEGSATTVFGETSIHVILKGLIDFGEEKKRIRKSIAKIEKDLNTSEKKLSNKGFLDKAPENIVAEVKAKAEMLSAKRDKLAQNLSFLEKIDG